MPTAELEPNHPRKVQALMAEVRVKGRKVVRLAAVSRSRPTRRQTDLRDGDLRGVTCWGARSSEDDCRGIVDRRGAL